MTFTHFLIIWTLLGVLLIWIFLFTFLALRSSEVVKTDEMLKEPDTLLTPQTSVIHAVQHTVSAPTHVTLYEPVSEVAPFV